MSRLSVDLKAIEHRFWPKVDRSALGPGGCWVWITSSRDGRYGHFSIGVGANGRTRTSSTHRVSYELAYGPIPDGLFVLHRCDNPPCVNPAHLWAGTRDDNTADMLRKGRQAMNVGERSGCAKVSAEQVREIRRRHTDGALQKDIAASFGLEPSGVSRIVNGHYWKTVK